MSSLAFLLLLLIFVIPLTCIYLSYLPPIWLVQTISTSNPSIQFHIPTRKPILALTIDDSPSQSTSAILEVLRANDVHATFFVIGSYIDGHEEILREVVRHGSELANHAMHDAPSWKLEISELREQILQTQDKIEGIYRSVASDVSKTSPRYFRPGSGFFTSRMLSLLHSLSYRLILGSMYPHDAQISLPSLNAWHVLHGARAGGIIICHDRPWTPQMLRRVLPELRRRGLRVGSLTEALHWADGSDSNS
ncbi:hypothetical protein LTR84_005741 [Exophiala bonariae]|uniref:chitin deacetylase n=1 Tax=Exophiala bonariae TaxID=1690606 RepID=A0AAV9N7B7_9EURO|nr:hypothetical protein LTR84_005741 [Exophiala bonariae]